MANNPEKLITLFEELADKLNIKLLQDKGDFTGGSCLVNDENFIVIAIQAPTMTQVIPSNKKEFSRPLYA